MPFEDISAALKLLREKRTKVSFAAQLTRNVKDELARGTKPVNPAAIKTAGDALNALDKLVAKTSMSGARWIPCCPRSRQ